MCRLRTEAPTCVKSTPPRSRVRSVSSCSLSSYYYQGSLNIPRLLISRWLFPPGLWTRSQALTSRCRRAAQSNSSVLPRDFQRKSESLSKNNYFDDCFVERVRFFKLTLIVDVNVVLYLREILHVLLESRSVSSSSIRIFLIITSLPRGCFVKQI